MKHHIEGTRLILTADAEERDAFREAFAEDPYFGTQSHEIEFLEPLLCNSELRWIDPPDTRDLTDAPMLGILGDTCTEAELPAARYGKVLAGFWDGESRWMPILKRWAFMSYESRSFLADLADKGEAVFVSE